MSDLTRDSAQTRADIRVDETPSFIWRGPAAVLVLLALAAGCWAVTIQRMQGMDMGPGTDLGGLGWFAVVWVTMMAAMMLPSLSPMAAAYAREAAERPQSTMAGAVVFAVGYLLVWAAFGLVAYAVFDGIRALHLGFLTWARGGRYVAGSIVLLAGLYELTPFKASCLRHCRDVRFVARRGGLAGALASGFEQGRFCVGCSGAMMAALFALGVMSITWMIVIAGLIAAEKLLPWQTFPTGASAVLLALLGAGILVAPEQVPALTIPM